MRTNFALTAELSAVVACAFVAPPSAAAAPTPISTICAPNRAVSTCRSPGIVEIKTPRRTGEVYPDGYLAHLVGGHQ